DAAERYAKPLALRIQIPRQPLLFGDVAGNFCDADDAALGITDRRHRERNIETTAVLGYAHGLEMLETLAAADSRKDLVLLGLPIRRNEHANRVADQFGGGVPKELFRPRVARLNDAVEILRQNRVLGGFDDRREIGLGGARLLLFADVARDFRCADD